MCVFQDNSWRRPVIMAPEVATQPTTQAHSRPTPTRVGRPPLPVGLVSDAEAAAAAAAAVPPQPRTTLVLRNVPPRLTTQLLVETVCFKADFAVVVRNPQKGCASCGFAFVNFCDGTSAEQCLNDWQGRESLVGQKCNGKLHRMGRLPGVRGVLLQALRHSQKLARPEVVGMGCP